MGARTTTPLKRLGSWLARANNTVYQAATDGFVTAWGNTAAGCKGYTDGANPPVTQRHGNFNGGGNGDEGVAIPVKKFDYWKVTGAGTVFWIPLEP